MSQSNMSDSEGGSVNSDKRTNGDAGHMKFKVNM